MTGEDEIIETVAKTMLRAARDNEHAELRRIFWIAGRCENCGASHAGVSVCGNCGAEIVNRNGETSTLTDGNASTPQWWTVRPPNNDPEFLMLVVAGRVAVCNWMTYGIFWIGQPWGEARKALETANFKCGEAVSK